MTNQTIFAITMLSAAILIPGKKERSFFASLQNIEGAEWSGLYAKNKVNQQLDKALIFSSPGILPMFCELLVVLDPEYCNFDYLSTAIRNGCHLFLSERLNLNTEERKNLIHLAKEGRTSIQIKNDFLFQPLHQKIITRSNETCYIELTHSTPWKPEQLHEKLMNNLFLILKVTGVPVHKINVFCGTAPRKRPDILNIHMIFINGSTASLTFNFTDQLSSHSLKITHPEGFDAYDFSKINTAENSRKKSAYTAPSLLTNQINAFIKTIEEKSNPLFSLSDEIEAFLIMEKIKEKFDLHSVKYS